MTVADVWGGNVTDSAVEWVEVGYVGATSGNTAGREKWSGRYRRGSGL